MNAHDGRNGGSGTPIENELANWLRGLEPAGAPISMRLQTLADLRREAARPRSRFAWPVAAFSSAAALGTVVAGAGLMLLVLIVVAGLGHTAGVAGGVASVPGSGQAATPSTDYYSGPDLSPFFLIGLPLATLIAGASVLWPGLRRALARLAFGAHPTTPAAPLRLPRNLRSIPRLAWALGAVAIAFAVWAEFFANLGEQPAAYRFSNIIGPLIVIPLWVSVAVRYPTADRSARLILAATAIAIGMEFAFACLGAVNAGDLYPYWYEFVGVVNAAWVVAIAAGVAGRSGGVPRPPLAIAGVAVGAAFAMSATFFFFFGFG